MKTQSMLIIGSAILFMVGATWFSEVGAQPKTELQLTPDKKGEFPLGRKCVVTVDTYRPSSAVVGQANIVTGFAAPDTVTGSVALWNDEWIVIRDGTRENWIRMEKVVMVHVPE